ncbi:hypothetical protein [Paenibacillus agilis]|uniref:Uncharacterized protein n=1 Tax=Paenibacillus agilis TaxID=3020863 RepID=A0A559IDT0_9BACL|nr:hypothetical protein [Paenibacillus agilis]TVX85613.1 hypothetical protein FPZ44_24995 [Paenibacillus agilis]
MNSFTVTITPGGFTESLVYNGAVIIKRYERDETGWTGVDLAWDCEDLPAELIDALEERDEIAIMDVLSGR